MNVLENRLSAILSSDKDIPAEILQMCDELYTGEEFSLNFELQNELMIRLTANKYEEDVWDRLLAMISPNELAEELLNYLIQNNISLLTLCHMQLQDKWLKKLIEYDEAPLFTLAKRYYLSDEYSELDFFQFYSQYLWNRGDIALHLLDIYRKADKRRLLIFLCSKNDEFEDKVMLQWYQVAERIRGLTNSTEITSIYNEYRDVGIVLNEIASNYFTSEKILLKLLSVKGITHAKRIRENSKNTLKLKEIAEQHL